MFFPFLLYFILSALLQAHMTNMHPEEPLSSKASHISHTMNCIYCPCILSNNSRHKNENLDETDLKADGSPYLLFPVSLGRFLKKPRR